jgi:hypothetical protein
MTKTTKSILVSLAIVTVSTSGALAAHRIRHQPANAAANAYASMAAPVPSAAPAGPVSSSNHEMYLRNLRDSGYDPKNDFTAAGNMKTAQ